MRTAKNITNMVQANSPITGELLNMASTSFVDDLCTTVASYECQQIPGMLQNTSANLDRNLADYSMTQNRDKAATISTMFGPGSKKESRKLQKMEGVGLTSTTRYLGPQIDYHCSINNEITNRIQSGWKVFKEYNGLWKTSKNLEFKQNVFNASVITVLLSGLIAFDINPKQLNRLEVQYHRMCRVILAAHSIHYKFSKEHGKGHKLGNEHIRKTLQMK